ARWACDRAAGAPSWRSSARSYVVHRPRRAPARDGAGGEVAEAQLIVHLRDRARDLVPELGQVVALARAPTAATLRLERRARPLHRPHDLSHRDVLRRPCDVVAAGRP